MLSTGGNNFLLHSHPSKYQAPFWVSQTTKTTLGTLHLRFP